MYIRALFLTVKESKKKESKYHSIDLLVNG